MSTVSIDYFGMHGTGRNVTEAKRDAGAQIQKALNLDYSPHLMTMRGFTMMVYADPRAGYVRIILSDETGTMKDGTVYGAWGGSDSWDRSARIREARMELLHLTWEHSDGMRHPLATDKENKELASYFDFQLRYRDAKSRGMNDHDAHSYAGRNPGRPELWAVSA